MIMVVVVLMVVMMMMMYVDGRRRCSGDGVQGVLRGELLRERHPADWLHRCRQPFHHDVNVIEVAERRSTDLSKHLRSLGQAVGDCRTSRPAGQPHPV